MKRRSDGIARYQTFVLVKVLTLLAIVLANTNVSAQSVPPYVNFQAVARESNGDPIALRDIKVRLSVSLDSMSTSPEYTEDHDVRTDDLGLFSLRLGNGRSTGNFSAIPWTADELWLQVFIDTDGSGPLGYLYLGAQRIVSVPYAFRSTTSKTSDSAIVAERLSNVLAPNAGGTGSTEVPVEGGVAYGDGVRLRYTSRGGPGMLLVSTGTNAPEWKGLTELIDSTIIRQITEKILSDTSFLNSTSREVREVLSRDSMFISAIARDTILRREVERFVDSILNERPEYERIRDSLLGDDYYMDSTYTMVISRLQRDSTLTNMIREIVEELITPSWSLTGNAGTNSNEQFLGTRDATALSIRTNNARRMIITADGNVGMNTDQPQSMLDVAGSLGFAGPLKVDGSAGAPGMVLISDGPTTKPTWTYDLKLASLSVSGQTSLTTTTIGGALTVTAPSTFTDIVRFDDTVRFALFPTLPLARGSMLVGNTNGIATAVGAGSDGSVLSVVGGMPTWVPAPPSGTNVRNGLNFSGSHVELGGTLIKPTQIALGGNTLTLVGAGNVGIGVGAPAQRLDVDGNIRLSGALMPGGDAGVSGRVLTSRGPSSPSVWSDSLSSMRLSTTTLTGTTTITGPMTVGGPLTVNAPSTFNNTVTFSVLPTLPLAPNHLLVGSPSGMAVPFAPGVEGRVLTVLPGGTLGWSDVNPLDDSVLVFRNDTVRFSDTTVVNIGDNITVMGDTTLVTNAYTALTGDTVVVNNTITQISSDTTVFNGPSVTYSDSTTVVFEGPVVFDSTVVFTTLPDLPLPQGHLFVGDASNVAIPMGPGSPGQVLTAIGPNMVGWTDVGTSFDTTIIFTGDSVVFSDSTTVIMEGPVTILGDTTIINSEVTSIFGDSLIIINEYTSITADTMIIDGGDVFFGDTTNVNFGGPVHFDTTVVFEVLPTMPLDNGHILVGSPANIAEAVAPGAEGDVLRISAGRPIWQSPSALETHWKVGGNHSPTSNIIGNLTPNGPLEIYAGGQQRIRVDGSTGNVRIPEGGFTVDGIVGSKNVRLVSLSGVPQAGPLTMNESIIVADASGDLRKVDISEIVATGTTLSGSVSVPIGSTTVVVNDPNITNQSRIILTIEDLSDSGFVFAQVVAKAPGTFTIRLSAPPSNGLMRVAYMFSNP